MGLGTDAALALLAVRSRPYFFPFGSPGFSCIV